MSQIKFKTFKTPTIEDLRPGVIVVREPYSSASVVLPPNTLMLILKTSRQPRLITVTFAYDKGIYTETS